MARDPDAPMMWRMVVRRADTGGHERVIVREFDDDLKAIRYGMWQRIFAKFCGESVHVRGPELVVEPVPHVLVRAGAITRI